MAGGYEYSFADPPDDLKCPVCLHVCREAYQVDCCGKVFCKACIARAKERNNVCPTCCKESFNMFKDGRSCRDIKRLKVSCSNEGQGCDWSGELEDYDKHESECVFKEVRCPNESDCDALIQVQLLDRHLNDECPGRKVECPVCLGKISHRHMDSHPSVCPMVEIECYNSDCSVKFYRDQLEEHMDECPKEEIACPYKMSGCSATILREDKDKHLLEFKERHSAIANDTISTLRRQLDTAKSALESRCVPPVTFMVSNYRQIKESNVTWESPFFYSHPKGYKMQLEVQACTDDALDRNHLSVYISIDEDCKTDNSLVWPFAGTITIQVLNQCKDSGHYSQDLVWDNIIEDSDSLGYPEFISYSKLENTRTLSCTYLKDDRIYFRISKISVDSTCKPWLTCSPVANP